MYGGHLPNPLSFPLLTFTADQKLFIFRFSIFRYSEKHKDVSVTSAKHNTAFREVLVF